VSAEDRRLHLARRFFNVSFFLYIVYLIYICVLFFFLGGGINCFCRYITA